MSLDIREQIRSAAQTGRKEAETEAQAKIRETNARQEQLSAKEAAVLAEAQQIVDSCPEKVRIAARQQQPTANVLELSIEGDFTVPPGHTTDQIQPSWLVPGVAKTVFELLQAAKLEPQVKWTGYRPTQEEHCYIEIPVPR